jgi:hypothetical protein
VCVGRERWSKGGDGCASSGTSAVTRLLLQAHSLSPPASIPLRPMCATPCQPLDDLLYSLAAELDALGLTAAGQALAGAAKGAVAGLTGAAAELPRAAAQVYRSAADAASVATNLAASRNQGVTVSAGREPTAVRAGSSLKGLGLGMRWKGFMCAVDVT